MGLCEKGKFPLLLTGVPKFGCPVIQVKSRCRLLIDTMKSRRSSARMIPEKSGCAETECMQWTEGRAADRRPCSGLPKHAVDMRSGSGLSMHAVDRRSGSGLPMHAADRKIRQEMKKEEHL